MEKRKIFVIGHKNPDTDSVCSAIAYAQLKNEIDTENEYIPLRAGQTNEETQYVLKQFGVNAPQYVMDVKSQVKDIEDVYKRQVLGTPIKRIGLFIRIA